MGGDVLFYSAYISREELEAAQGFLERRTAEGGEVVENVKRETESAWGLEVTDEEFPIRVDWNGALHITHPGEYVLSLDSDSPAVVLLDGIVILSPEMPQVTIEPSVGLHTLEVSAMVEDSDGLLRLLWRPPPIPSANEGVPPKDLDVVDRPLEPIPASNLYHGDVRPLGLAGRFFMGLNDAEQIGEAAPDAMQVIPGIGGAFWYDSVVEGEHLSVWDGFLNVPESGPYRFRLGQVHGDMKVVIDGDTLIDSRSTREAEVELAAGSHRIRLEYATSAGSPWFEVLWTPPGQPESRIEPENLEPASEYMFRVVE